MDTILWILFILMIPISIIIILIRIIQNIYGWITYKVQKVQERKFLDRISAGEVFENLVEEQLKQEFATWFEKDTARLLCQVQVEKSTKNRIDFAFITTSGIYIIECKRWSGYVIGKPSWKRWVQLKFRVENEYPKIHANDYPTLKALRSPLLQTEDQRESLKYFFNNTDLKGFYQFKRFIVISDNADLSGVIIDGNQRDQDYIWMGRLNGLCDALREYNANFDSKKRISVEDIQKLYSLLFPYSTLVYKAVKQKSDF